MKNTDLRTQTKEARKALKRVAIRIFSTGKTRTKISKELGISRNTVKKWISNYKETGKLNDYELKIHRLLKQTESLLSLSRTLGSSI